MTQYPFVRARYYTPGGLVEARAILWHMAEGYSTVSYLTHPRVNVSADFVIERDGDIVQMVPDDAASHSAHVAIDPDDVDASSCGGLYDEAIAKAVLRASGWADVNAYVKSVEVEGFRSEGPNALQRDSIVELYGELRSRHPTIRGNLGHRDVQDYKSCPGCDFPWARIGGHGMLGVMQGSEDVAIQLNSRTRSDYKIDVPEGTSWWYDADCSGNPVGQHRAATLDYFGRPIGESSRAVRVMTARPYEDKTLHPTIVYMRSKDVGDPYYVAPDVGTPPGEPTETLEPGLYRVP